MNSSGPYGQFAAFYAHWHDEDWYAVRVPFLLRTARLSPGARVYEGGCGAGHLTGWLAEAGLSVTATDASPDMLRLAKERLERLPVRLYREDLRKPAFDGRYDAFIFCLDVIQYLAPEELNRLFWAVHEALVPGGMLIFDHLAARVFFRRAQSPPVVYRDARRMLYWQTAVDGRHAHYHLRMRDETGTACEVQTLFLYRKRQIRALLSGTGIRDVRVFSDYRPRRAEYSSERLAWFAKK